MNCKGRLVHFVAGFFAGSIILAALLFGFSPAKNHQSFNDAAERLQKSEVRDVNITTRQTDLLNVADSDPLVRLFQILFWLFLISPPIIVVLLLVIISKMNRKDSLE